MYISASNISLACNQHSAARIRMSLLLCERVREREREREREQKEERKRERERERKRERIFV